MNEIPVYGGSIIIMVRGAAHVIPVTSVVSGSGQISENTRKSITMEWILEGLALLFTGLITLPVMVNGGLQNVLSRIAMRVSASMLLVLAGVSAMTGARTRVLLMKVCPLAKTACTVLFIAGTAI